MILFASAPPNASSATPEEVFISWLSLTQSPSDRSTRVSSGLGPTSRQQRREVRGLTYCVWPKVGPKEMARMEYGKAALVELSVCFLGSLPPRLSVRAPRCWGTPLTRGHEGYSWLQASVTSTKTKGKTRHGGRRPVGRVRTWKSARKAGEQRCAAGSAGAETGVSGSRKRPPGTPGDSWEAGLTMPFMGKTGRYLMGTSKN